MDNETQNTAHYWISTGDDDGSGGYIGGCFETMAEAETIADEMKSYYRSTEPDLGALFIRRCGGWIGEMGISEAVEHDCTGDAPHEHAPTCGLALGGLETAPPWGGGNGNPRMDPKDCV